MLQKIPTWAFQLGACVAFFFGGIASKRVAANPCWQWIIKVQLAYMGCTMFWIAIMIKENNLIVQGIIWSTITIMLTLGVGYLMYHEPVSVKQWIGVILGLIAIILLSF